MKNYFDLKDINNIQPPKKFGYKAILVRDEINRIGFYELKKTEELQEIELLKQKLVDTDYQAIKFAEGQLTDDEYKEIRELRQAWRDKINKLEEELKNVD